MEKLGSPISSIVYNQLIARSKINSRLEDNLPYLQTKLFNSAWITCLSSVDILPNNKIKFTGPELAKKLVLSGGALAWDGTKFVRREGIGFNQPIRPDPYELSNFVYHGSNLGIKPMPGITSFQIKTKNLYGTLREAEIQFTVWSLDDLEVIENLYLRPGYHMVVEWGHSVGIDNSGNVVQIAPRYDSYASLFTQISAEQVYALIVQNRKNYFYGYDGFLGIVKNFSWSFRLDGGYDCSISVISKGEILESLTVRSGTPTSTETTGTTKSHEDFCNTNILTKFNCVCKTVSLATYAENVAANKKVGEVVARAATTGVGGVVNPLDVLLNLFNISTLAEVAVSPETAGKRKESSGTESLFSLQNFKENQLARDYYPEVIKVAEDYSNEITPYLGYIKYVKKSDQWWRNVFSLKKTNENYSYFSLGLFLYFLNDYIKSTNTSKKHGLFNYISTEPFFCFDGYVNLSPDTCIVFKKPVEPDLFPLKSLSSSTSAVEFIELPEIINIFLSTDFLESLLKEFLYTEQDPEEFDVMSFVMTLLKKLETAMGGINDFGIEYDEETNLYTIVDRKFGSPPLFESVPVLPLVGENSITTDVTIQTKITNKLGSQISIAAQGPDGEANYNSSLPEFKKWNQNLIDRYDIIDPTRSTTIPDPSSYDDQTSQNRKPAERKYTAGTREENYVLNNYEYAVNAGKRFSMDPLIILAQGATESGWGTSFQSKNINNFFGITAAGGKNEFWKGEKYGAKTGLSFRVYDSPQDSFYDFGRLIKNSSYYKKAHAVGYDYRKYAHEISYSAYITEKNGDNREVYKRNIINIYEVIQGIVKKKGLK